MDNKTVLITGGTGSLGKALVKSLLSETKAEKIIIFSRDELKQYEMAAEYKAEKRLRFFIGDVRDSERLQLAFHGVDVVIHAAALKQVPIMEYNPFEAIKTNVLGTENVMRAAIDQSVEKVLVISTDKAVNPINLYGATKLCAEKIAVTANAYTRGKPIVSAMRYGNVIGSRGSLVTLIERAKSTNRMNLTHEDMTRFWITLRQCVNHIHRILGIMQGGEIYIPKLPSMKVKDLILCLAPGIRLDITGIRPGEKMHERLLTEEEVQHSVEFDEYYIIEPQQEWWDHKNHQGGKKLRDDFIYASNFGARPLLPDELQKMISGEI